MECEGQYATLDDTMIHVAMAQAAINAKSNRVNVISECATACDGVKPVTLYDEQHSSQM